MGSKQGTTIIDGLGYTGAGGLGNSDKARIEASFKSSPVLTEQGNCTADGTTLKEWYQANVLDAEETENTLFDMGANMNYATAPGATKEYGKGGGLPAGPFVPSTASPGEGNGSDYSSIPKSLPVPGHEGSLGSVTTPEETSSASGNNLLTAPQTTGKSPSAS